MRSIRAVLAGILLILGCWLIVSSLAFEYEKEIVHPAGGRQVWLSLQHRVFAMQFTEILSGILLIIFAIQ